LTSQEELNTMELISYVLLTIETKALSGLISTFSVAVLKVLADFAL
jgi:hypothetical protein